MSRTCEQYEELVGYSAPSCGNNGDLLYRWPDSGGLRRTPSTTLGADLRPVAIYWEGKAVVSLHPRPVAGPSPSPPMPERHRMNMLVSSDDLSRIIRFHPDVPEGTRVINLAFDARRDGYVFALESPERFRDTPPAAEYGESPTLREDWIAPLGDALAERTTKAGQL